MKFCTLYSGSSGNSVFISDNKARILIDAGLSGKLINEALSNIDEDVGRINGILITHEHIDHIKSVGILSRKYDIPVYANIATWEGMKDLVGEINEKNICVFENNKEFSIGDISAKAFSITHDAKDPVGFRIKASNKNVTVATDIGKMTRTILENMEGSDLLLLESNHDIEMLKVSKYPYSVKKRIMSDRGHLSNEMAGKVVAYLAEKGMERFVMGHLSNKSNFPELVYETVKNSLSEKKIEIGRDINFSIANRNAIGKIYNL